MGNFAKFPDLKNEVAAQWIDRLWKVGNVYHY